MDETEVVSIQHNSIRRGRKVFLVAGVAAEVVMGVLTAHAGAAENTIVDAPAVVGAHGPNTTPITSPPEIVAVPHRLTSGWQGKWRGH